MPLGKMERPSPGGGGYTECHHRETSSVDFLLLSVKNCNGLPFPRREERDRRRERERGLISKVSEIPNGSIPNPSVKRPTHRRVGIVGTSSERNRNNDRIQGPRNEERQRVTKVKTVWLSVSERLDRKSVTPIQHSSVWRERETTRSSRPI